MWNGISVKNQNEKGLSHFQGVAQYPDEGDFMVAEHGGNSQKSLLATIEIILTQKRNYGQRNGTNHRRT